MAQPTRSRQDLRLDVLKKLDPVSEPKDSAVTSDSDSLTVLIDTLLAPSAESEDYVGDWIYVRNEPTKVDSSGNTNGTHNATTTTINVSGGAFVVGDGIQIESEIMRITAISGNALTVVRAIQGTTGATHGDGIDLFYVGPEIGEIVRVTAVDFSGTNSKLTTAPDFSGSLIDTQKYERHRKVRPNIINDRLDVILGLLRENVILPVTIVTDGDMETSGTGQWTASGTGGTPTLAKNTSTPNVRHGRQALSITNDGSTTVGLAKSTSMYLPQDTVVIVSSEVYITAGDAARITLRDITNGADIGTPMKSDESGWVHLENTFTIPAACEEVQVWLEAQATSDVIFFDHITVWPTADKGIDLPTFLEFIDDARELVYVPVGTGLTGSTNEAAYRINEGRPTTFTHFQKERDDTGVGASRFYREDIAPSNALWLIGRKPYDTFSGTDDGAKDVDTTQANRYVLTNMTAASIIDDLALDATEAEKETLARSLQQKALLLRFEISDAMARMTPPKKTITTPFTRK